MRAVLDPNVLISALLGPRGNPANVLRAWVDGRFELLISPLLLEELNRALSYPRLRKRIPAEDAMTYVEWLRSSAKVCDDPEGPPPANSRDPGDDYLLALAAAERAALVAGDNDLLALDINLPIYSPSAFLQAIEDTR